MFSFSARTLHSLLVIPALFLIFISNNPPAPMNGAPVAGNDSYAIHGCALPLNPSLVANDFDPDGDPITIISFPQPPAHGSLSRGEGNAVSYCAAAGYVGADIFTYQVCDNQGGCGVGNVTLNVVNQAPNGGADFYNVHGSTIIGPFLVNDSDPNGDHMTCGDPQHECIITFPQHGSLFGLPQPDKKTYNPTPSGYIGQDSFTYNVCDSWGLCTPTTVTLSVNNGAPTASDHTYVIQGSTTIGPLLQGATDPDGDPLQLGDGGTFPAHGQLYGTVTPDLKIYNPYFGYVGTDSYTYQVCDNFGACSPLATITLLVIGDGTNLGVCDDCKGAVGQPINVSNGNMHLQQNDYQLPSVGYGIETTRTYNSGSQAIGVFGRAWTTTYDESILVQDNNLLRFNQGDGRAIYFSRPVGSSGVFTPLVGDIHAQITQNGSGFRLVRKDGSAEQFNSSGKLLSRTDRNGNTTSLSYGGNGFLSAVTDPFGRVLTLNTNAGGRVTSISDTMGTVATYTYGGGNQLLSVTYADNSAFNFSYDGSFRLTAVTDALGNIVEAHTYDGQGRALTSEKHGGVERYTLTYVSSTRTDVTDALGRVTKYTYDISKGRNVVTQVEGLCSCGGSQTQTWTYDNQLNMTSHTNALAQTATYTYDGNGNVVTATGVLGSSAFTYNQFGEMLTATDAMNGVTANTYDAGGNLLSVTNALNNPTSFTYDARGQLLTMTNALGKVTTLTWDTSGRLTQVKDALNNTTNFVYDARAHLTSATNALNFTTSYAYDAAGRVNKITRPGGTFITFTYDLAGRRTKVTDALNNSTTFAYDADYRLITQTDALLKSVSYTYDLMSNLTAATDQLAHTTNIDYDEFNRPIKTIYPPAVVGGTRLQETVEYDAVGNVTKRTDTAGRVTTFSYDNANRLVTVTDPALQVTQYEYNARSNVTAAVDALNQRYDFAYDALSRVTSTTRAGMMMSFAYDAAGNRIQRTDYNNMSTNYTYDALNRLIKITYPDASLVSYAYDKLSQLTTATNVNGTVSFVYDSLGRATSTTDVWGQAINYTYDANDRRTKMSFGATTKATYTYDVVDRLTKITDGSNLATSFAYDAASKLTSRTLPNSVVTTYTYDGLDRLTRLKDAKSNTVIADNNYTYNTAGQITQNIDQSGTHAYGYDTLDRLTSATYTGTPAESYAYDVVGNRTSSQRSASYTYQPFNRLMSTTTASYLYNNNGNMITKSDSTGTTQFAWDFEDRLTQVVTPSSGSVSYKYDALGRRIQSAPSTGVSTNFTYDGDDVAQDKTSTNVITEYLNGPGIDNKIRQKTGTTLYYFAQDHLGSTTALTDSKGALVERETYDAYGNTAGSAKTRYGFTGREREALTGLQYNRARFYDPQLGRFISEDPIALSGGMNQFAYVHNNPQNRTDPSGLFDVDVHYYLTYYLALKTGCFSDSEARLIAEGDQRSDKDADKKPGLGLKTKRRAGKIVVVPNLDQQARNRDFHSFGTAEQNARRAAELFAQATGPNGGFWQFGTYLHFLQDSFSHREYAGNTTWGQSSGINSRDHTSFDPEKAMKMAHDTYDALKKFGEMRGCRCDGDPDWNLVRKFVDVGYDRTTLLGKGGEYLKGVSDDQLREKIGILGVPWRSHTGR
jgi:RHS repeat-associated protein